MAKLKESADPVEVIKRALRKPPSSAITKSDQLELAASSGSVLLNLACAGKRTGAYPAGKFVLQVGDSASGKTFEIFTIMAELCRDSRFDKYRIVYDNTEDGALMDIAKLFGSKVVARLEPPDHFDDGSPKPSKTVEEFYYNHKRWQEKAAEEGFSVAYFLDSENALGSEAASEKFQAQMKAHEQGKEVAGSYGDAKAKYHSEHLREACADIRDTNSLLFITSQTRDKIGFGLDPKTRSGGRALKFYAALELWWSVKGKIKRTVRGKARQIGIISQVQVKKNRVTGRERTITIPILYSLGLDDVSSCIEYLLEEKHWSIRKGKVTCEDLTGTAMDRDELVAHIESRGLEKRLGILVRDVWNEIEAALQVKRKRRYE